MSFLSYKELWDLIMPSKSKYNANVIQKQFMTNINPLGPSDKLPRTKLGKIVSLLIKLIL